MVTVNKNNIVNSENISLKKHKVFKEDLDGVFAELFSLVDMENIEIDEKTNKNSLDVSIENKEAIKFEKNDLITLKDSDENILAAAQSLVSLFYKELNLENPDEKFHDNTVFKPNDVQFKNQKNPNDPKFVNKIEESESELRTFTPKIKKDENFFTNKENSQDLSKKNKVLGNKHIDINKIKSNLNKTETKLERKNSDKQIINDNEKLIGNREIWQKQNKNTISKKKINKNKLINQSYKVEVKFENKEIKNSTELTINYHNTFLQNRDQKSQINLIERTSSNKNHNSKALVNNLGDQKSPADKNEILDLMESAWGEKFVKIVKNNIARGVNRINLSLEPKNLGKLKVEVEVTGKETELKILSDNKQTITTLNENFQKLNEMFKEDNLKLSNFSTMFNQNNDNSKNKNSEKKNDRFNKEIGKKIPIQKSNEIINTKKSNHKVDKIA